VKRNLFFTVTQALRTVVRLRRAVRGPLRPTWDERFETWATMLHFYGKHSTRLPLSAQRRSLGGALAPGKPTDVRYEKVDAGGVRAEWFIPDGADPSRVLYYLHGGGYVLGSIESHRDPVSRLARAAKMRALVIDYRLAPEHPFPAQLEDATAAYKWLLASGLSPSRIAVAGESAGAGLTMSLLVALREGHIPLPAVAACVSPWVDLEVTGGTMTRNAPFDYVTRGTLRLYAKWFAPRDATNPLASALHADLRGLPPLLLLAGGSETLLDDARRLSDRASAHGVRVTLEVEPDMIHAWPLFASGFPRCQASLERVGAFLREHVAAGETQGAARQVSAS
jgi:monoterpene epsilon-lactone hydrolase